MASIVRWLERGVEGRSPEAAATARRLRAFTLCTALLAVACAAADAVLGRSSLVGLELAAAAAFAALHVFGTSGSDRRVAVAAHCFVAIGTATILGVELSQLARAGIHGNTFWYAPLVPLAAAHLLGTRAAVRWTAGLVFAFAVQAGLLAGTAFPVHPRPVTIGDAFEQTLLVLVALAIADAARRAADLHLASAHAQRRAAEAATEVAIENAAALARTNRELEEARSIAEHANAARRNFFANVSHEIRTPLHGVIGMSELLASTPLAAEQADYLRTLRSSGETLLALLNDILDFSKIEAGRMTVEAIEFSLIDAVETVSALFAEVAQSKGLELVCAIDPALPERVIGDPVRLRQMLSNLVSNAVKFTAEGEVCVRVASAGDGDRIRFAVRDSGIGIPTEARPRLFELFEQVDASTSRRFGGTGLGLAISRQLARLLGGSLDVESEPGAGSCFTLELPLPPAVAGVRCLPGETLRGRRVLLIESHPGQRAAIAALLGHAGLRVCEAVDLASGERMLRAAAARGEAFDLLLAATPPDAAERDDRAVAASIDSLPAFVRLLPASELATGAASREFAHVRSVAKPVRRDLLLAACCDALGQPASRPVEAQAVTLPERPFSSLRVLLAEDNAVNQRIGIRFLERLGADVVLAVDGAVAVEAVRKDPDGFDLVLMDCQMPRLDGYAATEEIRALRDAERLPVIAVSASVFQSDLERCHAVGMNDVLSKPYTIEQLAAMIARWAPPGSSAVEQPSRAEPS